MTQIAVVGAGIAGLNAALTLMPRRTSDFTRNTMVQLACFSKLFHHCSILLEVRAGKHLRSQGWGYVKGIAIALCLIQSRPGVSLLRRGSMPLAGTNKGIGICWKASLMESRS
jgi:hypothetical protein